MIFSLTCFIMKGGDELQDGGSFESMEHRAAEFEQAFKHELANLVDSILLHNLHHLHKHHTRSLHNFYIDL